MNAGPNWIPPGAARRRSSWLVSRHLPSCDSASEPPSHGDDRVLANEPGQMAHVASALIEGNPFAQALYRLATQPTLDGFDPDPWEGTAAGQPLIPSTPAR